MLKQFFNPDLFLCIQTNHCTLKYLLFSKSKKKFNLVEQGEASLECKTALHNISKLSKKYPTQALLPSHQGTFLRGLGTSTSGKSATLFLKRKTENELLENEVKLEPFDYFKNKSIFFYYPQKVLNRQQELLGSLQIEADTITPTCFGAYQYLLKNIAGDHTEHWIFLLHEEVICLQVKNSQLLDGFSFPVPQSSCQNNELLKLIYYLKEQRSWQMNKVFVFGHLKKASLQHIERQTSLQLYCTKTDPRTQPPIDPALQLSQHAWPSHFSYPLNFKSTQPILSRSAFKRKKLIFSSIFILSLTVGAQALNWTHLIRSQKHKNMTLFASMQKTNPFILPQSYAFRSSSKDLKTINLLFKQKKKELAHIGQVNQEPQLAFIFSWLTYLNQEFAKKEKGALFSLTRLNYNKIPNSENTYALKCSFDVHPPKSMAALDELIKQNSPPNLQSLSTSFQNTTYEASFHLLLNQ